LQNALAIRKKPCYNAAVIESEIFRAGFGDFADLLSIGS
jgi:hypothetical protein